VSGIGDGHSALAISLRNHMAPSFDDTDLDGGNGIGTADDSER